MKVSAARELLESLAEFEVGRVIFGPFYVSIDLLGERNVFLRINKPFAIVRQGKRESFELESAGPQPAAAELAGCMGSKVGKVQCAENRVEVAFSNGSVLSVSLSASDFEPVEVSCCHHLAPSELLWFTTIEAE